jgi:hypothetical protein
MAKSGTRTKGKPADAGIRIALWAVVAVLLGGALYVCSRTLWGAVARRPEFELDPLALNLNGAPEWVNAATMALELRKELAEVPRGRSLFDPEIVQTMRDELRSSPWVLDVTAVERQLPNCLLVKALFRKPAAVLLMGGRHYLVDADGRPAGRAVPTQGGLRAAQRRDGGRDRRQQELG